MNNHAEHDSQPEKNGSKENKKRKRKQKDKGKAVIK